MSFFKKLSKSVGKVAKVAVTPAALIASASLNSVGLRGAANKVIDKTALNKKLAAKEKTLGQLGGYVIDAGAAVVVGAAAAPTLSAAAHTSAAAALKAGTLLKAGGTGLLAKFGGLFAKKEKPTSIGDVRPDPAAAPSALQEAFTKGRDALKSSAGQALTNLRGHAQGAIRKAGQSLAANVERQISGVGAGDSAPDGGGNPLMNEASMFSGGGMIPLLIGGALLLLSAKRK